MFYERRMHFVEGWIKIYRKTLDNPIVTKDGDYLAIWIYLLLNATHKEYDVLFGGKRTTLKKGQLLTGRQSISQKLKINEYKVQRVLKSLENEHQIAQQKSNKNRLITIVSWNKYQEDTQQDAQQVHNKCTTTAQQLHTNKNVKNIKNDKNVKNNIIYGESEDKKTGKVEIMEVWEIQFNEFYRLYPRKVKKQDVKKWFKKNKPSNELFSSMLHSLEQFRASKDWQKDGGQFIPYPTTWLNQKRWEDECVNTITTGNPFLDLLREEEINK